MSKLSEKTLRDAAFLLHALAHDPCSLCRYDSGEHPDCEDCADQCDSGADVFGHWSPLHHHSDCLREMAVAVLARCPATEG